MVEAAQLIISDVEVVEIPVELAGLQAEREPRYLRMAPQAVRSTGITV